MLSSTTNIEELLPHIGGGIVTPVDTLAVAASSTPTACPPIDPELIDEARRAATRNRLIGEGATAETGDAWIAAWKGKGASVGAHVQPYVPMNDGP
jgi:hypothetical protein